MKNSALLLLVLCVAATPPALPRLKKHYKSGEVTSGMAAAKLIAKAPRAAAAPSIRLDWDFDGDAIGIVFNVRAFRGPLVAPQLSWPIVAVVTSNTCLFALNPAPGALWFSVTSSNTITGLESNFASR